MRFRKPALPSEGHVQAEFFRRCRNAGLDIYPEYYHKRCRFDAVIVRGDTIVAIVECKRTPRGTDLNKHGHEQRRRYGTHGVPIVWVRGMGDIERAYAEVRRIVAARSGGGWTRPFSAARIDGTRSVDLLEFAPAIAKSDATPPPIFEAEQTEEPERWFGVIAPHSCPRDDPHDPCLCGRIRAEHGEFPDCRRFRIAAHVRTAANPRCRPCIRARREAKRNLASPVE